MQGAQPSLRPSGAPGTVQALAVWWYRLLDGPRPWGFFDAMVGVAAAAYLGVGAVLFALTAGTPPSVRSMSLILPGGELTSHDRRSYLEWEKLIGVLSRAENLLKAGAINPIQHEALWRQAYDGLEEPARV